MTDPYLRFEAGTAIVEHMLDTVWRENNGVGMLRLCAFNLAPFVTQGWEYVRDKDALAFDFEFVPWFCATQVDWDTDGMCIYGNPSLKPGWERACQQFPSTRTPVQVPPQDLLFKTLHLLNAQPRFRNQAGDSYDLAAQIQQTLES